jgi:N-acyl-D-amino-acid deacylase
MTISRRSFVLSAGATLAGLAGAPRIVLPHRRRYALVMRGGTVFDGLGKPGIVADVAIDAGRITAIGRALRDAGAVEIDARGLAVAPGFIDIHSHGDGTLWDDPRGESLVRQGITTIVVGQDGSSRAGGGKREAGSGEDEQRSFATFAELWPAIGRLRPSVNVASMVGLGTLRGVVIGNEDRPATPDEVARMTRLVEQALAEGACGASTGLEYTPGAFATRDELIALCKPLASRRLPYATHMRNEDDQLLEAIDESIAVAKGAGCPLQVSHLKTQGPRNWGKLDAIFARLAAVRDAAFDRYPYIAYQTGLTNLFPIWSRAGSSAQFIARLDDPATAERIKRETLAKVDLIGGWDHVQISGVSNKADSTAEGKRLGTYASAQGADPYALTVALLKRGSVGMVGFAMSEENLERILAHPSGMVCSDGGAFAVEGLARRGHPHPRGLGTFPRVLGRYVRERKALKLEQAINKMTALPASRIRVTDRGRLAAGLAADVVVFDPATVADRATFEEPFQYPAGLKAVVVNGTVALMDGERGPDRGGVAVLPARNG